MQKEISIKEFGKELKARIDAAKTIDCCKEEIKRLADIAAEAIGDRKILVTWKD
jgi:hypothetical protein